MTESTALTVLDEQREIEAALQGYDLGVAGEENLEQGDIGMPPRLRISSQNKPIKVGETTASPGSIVNTLTGDIYDTVDIVPLVFLPRTRVMWPDTYSSENDPLCASDDGKFPTDASDTRVLTDPQPGPCAECAFSAFGDNGTAPACKMQRNFLVFLVDQQEPAILTLQSSSIKAAKQLTALAKAQGLKKSITFATRFVEDDKGTYYVAAFGKGRTLTVPEIITLVQARDELQNLVITADVEQRENGHSAPAAEPFDDEDMPF